MQKAISILEMLSVHLPEMKQALGERWPALVGQMQAQATSFENLTNEEDLAEAANQLLGLFMMDEAAREILTRPNGIRTRHPQPRTEAETPLETIANRFYDLCMGPDKAAESSGPTKPFKPARARSQPKHPPAQKERDA